MNFASQIPSVLVLHQQMVTGLSLETHCSDFQVVVFELPHSLRSESSSLERGVDPVTLEPMGQECLDWEDRKLFQSDPSPHSQGLLLRHWKRLSQRPSMILGARVSRWVCPHLPIVFPLLPQKTTWKPSSWEMHPVATTSSSSPRQYGQRVASGPKYSSSKHYYSLETFPRLGRRAIVCGSVRRSWVTIWNQNTWPRLRDFCWTSDELSCLRTVLGQVCDLGLKDVRGCPLFAGTIKQQTKFWEINKFVILWVSVDLSFVEYWLLPVKREPALTAPFPFFLS